VLHSDPEEQWNESAVQLYGTEIPPVDGFEMSSFGGDVGTGTIVHISPRVNDIAVPRPKNVNHVPLVPSFQASAAHCARSRRDTLG
jgi:hypothetical protein